MTPTTIPLADYVKTRAWQQLDSEQREHVFNIAAISKEFYLTGFYSNKEKCWLLDEFPAHPDRDDAREIACTLSREFPEAPTRTWKVIQQFPRELETIALQRAA